MLLLLTVDTLRADRLGAYGSKRGLTPHLDALAATSEVFTAAYAPASFTLPSVITLLTGRYPEELGIIDNKSVLAASVPTLAAELCARGWRSVAVVSNFVLRRQSGLDAGFERFDDRLPQMEATRPMPERIAEQTTDALLEALDFCTQGEDWSCFLWGHYQDPHGPYTPPAGRRQRYLATEHDTPDGRRRLPIRPGPAGLGGIPSYQVVAGKREVAWYRAGYHGEISYVDEEIGRLLAQLEARGLFESAVIVFASDHGEGLGENDYWFSHGRLLTDSLVRVPLFVRAPGRLPGRRDDVVALVDLFPTLLHLLTEEEVDGSYAGRDLLAADAARRESVPYLAALAGAPFPRYGLVEGGFKLLRSEIDGEWREQLFLRGREAVDVAPGAPDRTRAMRESLETLRRRYARGAPASTQTVSPKDREELRALGYAE